MPKNAFIPLDFSPAIEVLLPPATLASKRSASPKPSPRPAPCIDFADPRGYTL